jgi:hypothetical protein
MAETSLLQRRFPANSELADIRLRRQSVQKKLMRMGLPIKRPV